jgi:hypothetical protein
MNTGIKKQFWLAAIMACVAGTALASATLVNGVLTFDVATGNETYSAPIDASVNTIVKIGAGTMTVTGENTGFTSGKTVSVQGGILEMANKNALGSSNTVTVSSGAQLKMSFNSSGQYGGDGSLNALVISGTGPDATGAVRVGGTTSGDAFFGDVTLTDDATMGFYHTGTRGFGALLDLNGKTLTCIGNDVGVVFGAGLDRVANRNVIKAGHIVFNGPATVLEGTPVFEGGGESTITLKYADRRFQMWSCANPIPWTLNVEASVNFNIGESLRSGVYATDVNEWSGPITLKSNFNVSGNTSKPLRAATWSGTLSDDGTARTIYMSNYALLQLKGDNSSFGNGDGTGSGFSIGTGSILRGLNNGAVPGGYVSLPNVNAWVEYQVGEGFYTAAGAAAAIATASSWAAVTGSGFAAIRTVGDYDFTADIPVFTNRLWLAHTGSGKLTFSGALAPTRGISYSNAGGLPTTFGGASNPQRLFNSLEVPSGTVEVASGSIFAAAGSGSSFRVGSSNDLANATLLVSGGSVDAAVKPNSANAQTAKFYLADTGAKPAVLRIEEGAGFTNNLLSACNAGEKSAIQQFGGDVFSLGIGGGNDGYSAARAGLGFYGLYGGTYSNRNYTTLCGIPGGRGLWLQTGGTAYFDGNNSDSMPAAMVSRGGEGEYLMKGGTVKGNGAFQMGAVQYNTPDVAGGYAVMSLHGGNPVFDFYGPFSLCDRTNGFVSVLNLNAGVFSVRCASVLASDRYGYLNFNGGTWKIRSGDDRGIFAYGRAPTAITVFEKGVTFDVSGDGAASYYLSTKGGDKDDKMVLKSATGRGVKSIKIPADMPRTGYVGIVPVKITGGNGMCATAALDFDPVTGMIAEDLLITCPGWDYTEVPTVTAYGPDYTTAYTCAVQLTDEDQDPGKIVKTGAGLFFVNCVSNEFVGTYVISNGTLKIPYNSEINANASVFVAGGKFWYDWRPSRTIKSLGGWGEFYGYPDNDAANNITVTDTLDFDAADIAEGRMLVMLPENTPQDKLILGANCKVRILNPELLDENTMTPAVLLKTNIALNRLPELENLPEPWRLRLTDDGKTLVLSYPKGTVLYLK